MVESFQALTHSISIALARYQRVLLAVSGGIDSMALLRLCTQLRQAEHEIHVMHIDHARRESSGQDAEFVRRVCQEQNVRCHSVKLETAPQNENFEAWARGQRYRQFRKICLEQDLRCTFTAHTADDLIETLLMRLVSNKQLRNILEFDPARLVFRPLLSHRKSELLDYLSHIGQSFVHDQTNDDSSYLRNRVRNELLPFLVQHFGSSVENSLFQQAKQLNEREIALDELANRLLQAVGAAEWGSQSWIRGLRDQLEGQPEHLKLRVLEQAMLPLIGYRLSAAKSAELLNMLCGNQVAVQLPGNFTIRRKNSGWQLNREAK